MKDKLTDQKMVDALHTETVSGHSLGDFGASGASSGSSGISSGGTSLAAETRYFFAVLQRMRFPG